MIKAILPHYERVAGKNKSKAFDKMNMTALASDVAIARGLFVHKAEDDSLKGRTGKYWLEGKGYSWGPIENSHYVTYDGDARDHSEIVGKRELGIRPALQFSSIDEIKDVLSGKLEDCGDNILKGSMYQPLYVPDPNTQIYLMWLKENNQLRQIEPNKVCFPVDSTKNNEKNQEFKPEFYRYYEHDGNIYLLLDVQLQEIYKEKAKFSNGQVCQPGDSIFIKVEKADVYIDTNINEAYFAPILSAGVPISHTGNYPGNFEQSDMGRYLKLWWEESLKLQQVVRELKEQNHSNPDQETGTKKADTTHALVELFGRLNNKRQQLESQIKDLKQKLEQAEHDKHLLDQNEQQLQNLGQLGDEPDER